MSVRLEWPRGDEREVLACGRSDGVGIPVAKVEMPVHEGEAEPALTAQRKRRPEKDAAIASEHDRPLPCADGRADQVCEPHGVVGDRRGVANSRDRVPVG